MDRFTIIADDLTGALDCAAAFIPVDGSSRPFVAMDAGAEADEDAEIVSINADSRRMSSQLAGKVLDEAVARLTDFGQPPRYVKIDSTLRGHPGLEIDRCARVARSRLVLFTPAFPATGRTVRDGELRVHGVALADTDVGRDPLSPAETSNVSEIVRKHTDVPARELHLEVVRSRALANELEQVCASSEAGPVILSCDAETDSDLDAIVAAGASLNDSEDSDGPPPILFAGSAGLAFALARRRQTNISGPRTGAKIVGAQAPVLVVTASQRPLADEQIAVLAREHGAVVMIARFDASGEEAVFHATELAEQSDSVLSARRHLILRATIDGDLTKLSPANLRSLADSVTDQLGSFVAKLAGRHHIGGLVIIGGDTAYSLLAAVGARGIVLAAEPLPGVPVGTITGGLLDGVTIATKAGAFGDARTLAELFKFLNEGAP